MKKIDFEAHFLTEEYIDVLQKNKSYPRYAENPETGTHDLFFSDGVALQLGDQMRDKLLDLGEGRLGDMDAGGVDVQVLSLTAPGLEQLDSATAADLSKKSNDHLAEAIHRHPDRFMGFAALAPQDPQGAARELERAVKELGFRGWNTHSNFGDSYLDDDMYRPILAKAEELGALIYLHPTAPSMPELCKYGFTLAGAPFGFGADTAMCMMRLILSGVFDRHPKLKIMLGHFGEALAFQIERIDRAYTRPPVPFRRPDLEKKPSDYLRENVYVTTSGNFFESAFTCTADALGIDRIFLGIDSPYEKIDESLGFLEALPISREDLEKIYYKNAERIGFSL